jgi:hypothetical protein
MPRKKSFIRLVGCCGLAAVFGEIYPSSHGAAGGVLPIHDSFNV